MCTVRICCDVYIDILSAHNFLFLDCPYIWLNFAQLVIFSAIHFRGDSSHLYYWYTPTRYSREVYICDEMIMNDMDRIKIKSVCRHGERCPGSYTDWLRLGTIHFGTAVHQLSPLIAGREQLECRGREEGRVDWASNITGNACDYIQHWRLYIRSET